MRLQVRFKDKAHPMQEQFGDISVTRIVINPPNSMLVSMEPYTSTSRGGRTTVLLISDMAKVDVT